MKTLQDYLKSVEVKVIKAEKKSKKEPFKLFDVEPDWNHVREALKCKRCPDCGSLLKKIPFDKPKIIMCAGKRHSDRKPYILTPEGYSNLIK